MLPARLRNASSSGFATNSAISLVTASRSRAATPLACRTAASASAPSATICDAIGSSLLPPAVSVIPPERLISNLSPWCWRSAASAWDTAGSLTPSAFAASVTDPSLATSTNAFSWPNVMRRCSP